MSTYYVPCTVLSTSHTLAHFVLIVAGSMTIPPAIREDPKAQGLSNLLKETKIARGEVRNPIHDEEGEK